MKCAESHFEAYWNEEWNLIRMIGRNKDRKESLKIPLNKSDKKEEKDLHEITKNSYFESKYSSRDKLKHRFSNEQFLLGWLQENINIFKYLVEYDKNYD